MKSKGFGDTIEKFTKATGIKKLADSIPGGCGCDERKQWFNKNFPYNINKQHYGKKTISRNKRKERR